MPITKIRKEKNSLEFHRFFRAYLNSARAKALFFVYPSVTNNILELLKYLEKDSRIAGYHVTKDKQIKVFLNYDMTRNEPLVQKIILFSSKGRKRIATLHMLKLFNHHYPNSLALLRTRYGLLNLKDCQAKKCGGEFVVSIT